MWVSWQTLITIGGGISVLCALVGSITKIHNVVLEIKEAKKENERLRNEINAVRSELEGRISQLKKYHDDDMRKVNDENSLVCFALSACLEGLKQLGAKNDEVPEAKKRLDKYLNQQAHE